MSTHTRNKKLRRLRLADSPFGDAEILVVPREIEAVIIGEVPECSRKEKH